jgi:phosphate transport system protein
LSTAFVPQLPAESEYEGIIARAARAAELTRGAVGQLADVIAFQSESAYQAVKRAEEELDDIDRAVDATMGPAITHTTLNQSRELLACMKFVIDLERIGDLIASVAGCAHALGTRVPMDDVAELVKMTCVLEKMLADVVQAFDKRDTQLAMLALKTDSELDRARNLFIIRHLEQAQTRITGDSVQILFMAQSLERAGDHVKNLAEEICHLVSGQTVRHLIAHAPVGSQEQMYIEYLRQSDSAKSEASRPTIPATQGS